MGFLDGVKEKYDKYQEKMSQLKEARGKLLATPLSVEFIGGYDEHKKASGTLSFYQNQTEFSSVFNKEAGFIIPTQKIKDIVVEGKDEVNKRVTVTRLLALGIFAFALKKKTEEKEAYVTLILTDGQEIVFHIDNKSPLELKRQLANAVSQIKQDKKIDTNSSSVGVADELEKLAGLKEKGIISQEEFNKKKTQILGL